MIMTSIVLAGGRSLRLGRNKILETLGGKALIEWVVERLAPISDQVIIASVPGQRLPRFHQEVETVFDAYPGKSSLGGLYSGLQVARSFHSLAVAADMPFLNHSLLCYMMEVVLDFDVVAPRLSKFVEPLHAIYSKNCLEAIEAQLKSGQLSMKGFFPRVKVRYLDENELDRFDPEHLSFFNVNTEADLKKAKDLVAQQDAKRGICP
jgi:molybdopterin-guanine dinucleotide biosynthesis protein A